MCLPPDWEVFEFIRNSTRAASAIVAAMSKRNIMETLLKAIVLFPSIEGYVIFCGNNTEHKRMYLELHIGEWN